jgi:hypothetical protein
MWHYQGDMSLEYGGTFTRLREWRHGYVEVCEVTDLGSACGYRGAILIEMRTIAIDRKDRWEGALPVIGCTLAPNGDIVDNGRSTYRKRSLAWHLCLVHALNAYGYHDTDRSEVIQLDRDGAMQHDGWRAEKRLRSNASLRNYVRREFLRAA